MSQKVRLASVLPADSEVNGIDHVKDALIDDPERLRFAVISFGVRTISHHVAQDTDVPTIEIQRIEYVGDQHSLSETIRAELVKAAQDRLGHEPLPFDQTDPAGVSVSYDEDRDDSVLGDLS